MESASAPFLCPGGGFSDEEGNKTRLFLFVKDRMEDMVRMGRIWITVWVLLSLLPRVAKAQYDPSFVNYWAMTPFYNPAATGQDPLLNFQGGYSMQMTGFENAPAVMYAYVDLPLFFISDRHGAGVGFMNDQIGLFKHQKFYLQYAYHQPLWGGRLSGGIHLSMLSETFDGGGLDLEESGDPAFPTSEANGAGFDLNFGIQYARKSWYVGFSMMHCTSPTVTLGDEKVNEFKVSPSYYLTGGYNIRLKSPLYTIHTAAMVRSDGVGIRGDVTARLAYHGSKHKMYGGLSYSPMNSVSFLFGLDFHGINLGYAYEMYTAGIGALNGSHEILIGYKTELDLFKKGKNKHKSVRIL